MGLDIAESMIECIKDCRDDDDDDDELALKWRMNINPIKFYIYKQFVSDCA